VFVLSRLISGRFRLALRQSQGGAPSAPEDSTYRPPRVVDRMTPEEVLEALLKLTPSKQAHVIDQWPGLIGKTREGLEVTAKTPKELRRFTVERDPGMMAWIESFEPGEVFYDIGANVGGVTLAVAGLHGNRVATVAIEPSFASFESLARNLSRNTLLGFVIPLQVALLDRTGLEKMNYRSTAAGTSLHAVGSTVDHEGVEFTPVEVQLIPTYALDDLIEALSLPLPTRIKVDVDGYEEFVLQGAVRILSRDCVREVFVEIVDHDRSGTRLEAVTELLGGVGYELVSSFRHAHEHIADHLYRRGDLPADRADTGVDEPVPAQSEAFNPRNARELRLKEKNVALQMELADTKAKRGFLAEELAELKRSYYLSGARKKLDLNELPGFAELARQITSEDRVGMQLDRLYTLWQAVLSAPAGPVVEVGVYKGGSAKFITETLRQAGREPFFYACDTFVGHASTDAIDATHHTVDKFLDTSVEEVRDYLSSYPNLEFLVGDIEETSARLVDGRFGFVHVDVDVYRATGFCLRFFAPRLAPGAVIVVDDYGFVTCPGAKQAVDEFMAENEGFRLFHLLTGQAILFQLPSAAG